MLYCDEIASICSIFVLSLLRDGEKNWDLNLLEIPRKVKVTQILE